MSSNAYIQNLENQNKLKEVTDPSFRPDIRINGKTIGEDCFVIAGPCSVESREQIVDFSRKLADVGVDALRGGAYKPCTFPIKEKQKFGWQEGLREEGLALLAEAREASGLPIVTEVLDVRQVKLIADCVDVIQVGTRNFQNFGLLDELGKISKPILLKRGTWGTIDEILGACERIMHGGNKKVVICLRGVVGMPSYRHVFPSVRWAPDLMMIPALRELTNLPIIYDPSHSTGYANFVAPICRAAIAAGADGLAVESHPNPRESISDADQAIGLEQLREIMGDVQRIYPISRRG